MDLVLGLLVRIRQTLRPDLRIVVMSATLAAEPVPRLLGRLSRSFMPRDGGFRCTIRYQRRGEQRPLVDSSRRRCPRRCATRRGMCWCSCPASARSFAARMRSRRLPSDRDSRSCRCLAICRPSSRIVCSPTSDNAKSFWRRTSPKRRSRSRASPRSSTRGRRGRCTSRRRPGCRGWSWCRFRKRRPSSGPAAPGGRHPASAGGCGTSRRIAAGRRPRRRKFCAAIWPNRCCILFALGERGEFPWLDPPPAEAVENARRLLQLLGAIDADDRDDAARAKNSPACRPIRGWAGCCWPARGMACCVRLRLRRRCFRERDPFRSAQHGRARAAGIWHGADAVRRRRPRGARCRPFTPARARTIPTWNCIRAGRATCCGRPSNCFTSPNFTRRRGPSGRTSRSMQALLEAFPDRLAQAAAGTQDRGLMVGGRGVRLDASSRVRGEPLFLAIELNDAGGEARARLVSAVDRDWLPAECATGRGVVLQSDEAAGRRRGADVLGRPVARGNVRSRSATGAAAAMLAQQSAAATRSRAAGGRLARPANFLARVRWLAEAQARSELPALDESDLQQLLPEIATACDRSTSYATPIGSPGCKPALVSIGSRKSIGSRRPSWNCRAAIGTRSFTKPASRRCSRCGFRKCSACAKRHGSPAAACRSCCTCSGRTTGRSK